MKSFFKVYRPWLYGIITLTLSAFMYGIVILSNRPYMSFPIGIFTLIGGFMPFIAAVLFIKFEKNNVKDFLKQCFHFQTITKKHMLFLLGFLIFLTITPVVTTNLTNSTNIWFSNQLSLFIPIGFIFGAMEEPGWRGYMQKGMNHILNPLIGTLIVGVFWMLWHIPLFFIENTYQNGLGWFTLDFWVFNVSLIVAAPIYTYLFYVSKQSIPVVILYHGLSNVLRELLSKPNPIHAFIVELALMIFVLMIGRKYFFNKTKFKKGEIYEDSI